MAETPSAAEIVRPVLEGHFHLIYSHSLRDALRALEDDASLDLVLCGLHFDESRMFELLQHVRNGRSTHHIPFVCLNAKNSVLPQSVVRIAAKAVITMGGDGFIDLVRWRCVLGDDKAFSRFRAHLHLW